MEGPARIISEAPILIAGIGLLTPLGRTATETWQALLDGEFITDHARAAGEFDSNTPRVIQMARRAADEALGQANWSPADEYATVIGTSKGSIESWLSPNPLQYMAYMPYEAGGFDTAGLADISAQIANGYGPRLTVSAACASGLIALIRGAMLIRSGEARRVLVVAVEASVHPLFIGSFKRLGVLPAGGIGCRPFDETRDGFLMSEAAAAICLGASDDTHGVVSPRIALDQYGLGADAAHLTAADPTGRVLRHLMDKVTQDRPIDLVHAHGTGTIANDPVELAAIESVFKGATSSPCLYSHKGALGHSLGAAGLIAVVLNVLAHQQGIVPSNIRTTQPLATRTVTIASTVQRRPIHRSLALAAGFGGATAAVGLASV